MNTLTADSSLDVSVYKGKLVGKSDLRGIELKFPNSKSDLGSLVRNEACVIFADVINRDNFDPDVDIFIGLIVKSRHTNYDLGRYFLVHRDDETLDIVEVPFYLRSSEVRDGVIFSFSSRDLRDVFPYGFKSEDSVYYNEKLNDRNL